MDKEAVHAGSGLDKPEPKTLAGVTMEYLGFAIELRQERDCHIGRVTRNDGNQFYAKGPRQADFSLVAAVETLPFQSKAEAITEAKLMAESAKVRSKGFKPE